MDTEPALSTAQNWTTPAEILRTKLDEAVVFSQWPVARELLGELTRTRQEASHFSTLRVCSDGPIDLAVDLARTIRDPQRLRLFVHEAACKGQAAVVKGLLSLPGANATFHNSQAINAAAVGLHTETVAVLFNQSKPEDVARQLAFAENWPALDCLLEVAALRGHRLARQWLKRANEHLPQTQAAARLYRAGNVQSLPESPAPRRRARP